MRFAVVVVFVVVVVLLGVLVAIVVVIAWSGRKGNAAGVPQLVWPLVGDQPDNAARLKRLGVGRTLYPKDFTPKTSPASCAR